MIYLDNASTTPVFEQSASVLHGFLCKDFFNPSASYAPALKVKKQLNNFRTEISNILKASANEIYFTSGATESNTWVLKNGFKNKKGNIVISAGEHASVYENAIDLRNKGYDVRIAVLNNDGTVNMEHLSSLIDGNTALVSIIHCNNETGAINNLKKISQIIKNNGSNALFHSDGVQSFCKLNTNCKDFGVDFYSISAHKVCAPKGVGALYINSNINISPLILGGGQEKGMRSGTENISGIAAFADAATRFSKKYVPENISALRTIFLNIISSLNPVVNTAGDYSPHILSLSFNGIRAEILQSLLSESDVIIGLGSACSGKSKYNRVLSSMSISQKLVEGSVRVSFGLQNTVSDVEQAAKIMLQKVKFLRGELLG